jgi:hypothetical protein
MREPRSASQILFNHLPEQTVDAAGGIWKVKRWNDPGLETGIDLGALREELIRAASAWAESGEDGDFVADLRRQRTLKVKKLNRDEGVWCEPFPRLYLCQACSRLHDGPRVQCQCGSNTRKGQLPFVGYHEKCGSIKTPYVKKCPTHSQRAVKFPGTASAAELIFYCPVCKMTIQRGFGAACDCDSGGTLSFTVHRSGTVFKARSVVLINPARREVLNQVELAGGGARALDWLIAGMQERRLTESKASNDPDSIRTLLRSRGFDESIIETIVAAVPVSKDSVLSLSKLSAPVREQAQLQARQIALATFESRQVIADLRAGTESEALKELYDVLYPQALREAGLDRIELIDRFPVLTAQYGYTRGATKPGEARLRTYREVNGDYALYGELAQTEALFVRLKPLQIHNWLNTIGFALPVASDDSSASITILENAHLALPRGTLDEVLLKLIHSYAHSMIRRASLYAGIERSSLSELVLPYAFGFFVYAPAKGDFVLGGLQALFETELHLLLRDVINDDQRCALDPGCQDNGAACAVCLHLGEPSCRLFNTSLSRNVLAGGDGYLDLTAAGAIQ